MFGGEREGEERGGERRRTSAAFCRSTDRSFLFKLPLLTFAFLLLSDKFRSPPPPFFPPFPSEMAALATASKACAVVRSNSARAAPIARSCSSSRVVAAAAPAAAASPALASRSQRMSSASPAAGRGSVAAAAASNGGLSIDLRGKRVPDAENDAFLTENKGPSNESRSFFFSSPSRGQKTHLELSQLVLLDSTTGKKAFIAGVADDQGFGWAIAKALAEAGAEISLGVWVSYWDRFFFLRSIEASENENDERRLAPWFFTFDLLHVLFSLRLSLPQKTKSPRSRPSTSSSPRSSAASSTPTGPCLMDR